MNKIAEITVSAKMTIRFVVSEDYEGPPTLADIREKLQETVVYFDNGVETMTLDEDGISLFSYDIKEIE